MLLLMRRKNCLHMAKYVAQEYQTCTQIPPSRGTNSHLGGASQMSESSPSSFERATTGHRRPVMQMFWLSEA